MLQYLYCVFINLVSYPVITCTFFHMCENMYKLSHLRCVQHNLNTSIAPHLLSPLLGSLPEDNNNAEQEPIVLYN